MAKALEAARILGNRGVIAGGFARDVRYGHVPKDMDIFCAAPPQYWENRRVDGPLLRKAARIMALFGQEPDLEQYAEGRGRYGHEEAFVAVKSKPQENPEWQPVDVVFNMAFTGTNPAGFVSNEFDLDICKIYIDPTTLEFRDRGCGDAIFRGYEVFDLDKYFRFTYTDFSARIKHLREKYPDLSVRVDLDVHLMAPAIQAFIDEGVYGAAREILQEQAEEPIGDPVRLHNGENLARLLHGWRRGFPGF